MKKLKHFTLAVAVLALMSFISKKSHTDVYKVDTKLSTMEWFAEKVNGKHNGTIALSGGQIMNNHGSLNGDFTINMKSIANKDIEPGEKRAKLEGHLKSPDFFDVEKFPEAKFVISSITPVKEPVEGKLTHTVKGMLSIKGKTNEISFNAALGMQGSKLVCTGTAVVDRSKYDVRYGSKTFFADIGDKMINDEFTLKFNVVADKMQH